MTLRSVVNGKLSREDHTTEKVIKTVALCINLPVEDGSWRDRSFGKRFPGAGYCKYLVDGTHKVMAGKQVLEHIRTMTLAPSEVIVIQEENNPEGQELVKLGADPRVNYCMESPIYASQYYDNIPRTFRHTILFDGGTDRLNFPSFDDADIQTPVAWNERKFLCMVMSNKHYSMQQNRDFMLVQSKSHRMAIDTQLHDYRYDAIKYFLGKEGFKLYGKGWPEHLQTECDDKLSTIRNYKFALCFENGSYPGYITEKIIDCLVAGVIPVYRGAPDIEEYIPQYLYIQSDEFETFENLEAYLRSLSDYDKSAWVVEGQKWLHSPEGQRYNNLIFAKRVLELCK